MAKSMDKQLPASGLTDRFGRRISYLRLSVTDRCDLRCTYCQPAGGLSCLAREDLLDRRELVLLCRVLTGMGVRKIRLTGGEPLVRPDVVDLVREIRPLAGLEQLVMTTNGTHLEELASDLRLAGLDRVNISIDSLRPDRYRRITRGGDLARCRAGIEAALAAGFPVKLNVVVMAGVNEDEIPAFAALARELPVEVRFIEYMPTGGDLAGADLLVPAGRVLELLAAGADLQEAVPEVHGGPARVFRVSGWPGSVGVISPVSNRFCADCNRIRVTASGLARGCLFREAGLDLKPWLAGNDAEGLSRAIEQVVALKPAAHGLDRTGRVAGEEPGTVFMSRMGG